MNQNASGSMTVEYLKNRGCVLWNGVWCAPSPERNSAVERMYISLREKEGWLYPDELVAQLPDVDPSDQHYRQWQMRKNSLKKLRRYLTVHHPSGSILDVGSGNGWMAHALAASGFYVCGIDLNLTELQQSARVFRQTGNVDWIYGDICGKVIPPDSMDAAVLASSIQYFDQISSLLRELFEVLHRGGEIHILDTPFYHASEKKAAARRSQNYYARIGYPEFAAHYQHRTFEEFDAYPYTIAYNPKNISHIIERVFGSPSSPFPWIILKKC